MKANKVLMVLVLGAVAARVTLGESNFVITSFHDNGEITWNRLTNATEYRIEWASTLSGTWTDSWSSLTCIPQPTNASVTAQVPMFYRVVASIPSPVVPEGMVLVPAGSFEMGDSYSEGNADELPVHTVQVTAFYIERYEVTKALWDQVCDWATNNDYSFDSTPTADGTNHPLNHVWWYDCLKWCNARSEKEGLTPAYYKGPSQTVVYRTGWSDMSSIQSDWVKWNAGGYRLPTEAEWEKACRGGLTGHHYPWNSGGGSYATHIDGSKANYNNSGDPYDNGTTPVGYYDGNQIPPGNDMTNGYGLYDMAGNNWEWTWDRYQSNWYAQPEATQDDPRGPTNGVTRVLRGGSFGSGANILTCARRGGACLPVDTVNNHGFRCVR